MTSGRTRRHPNNMRLKVLLPLVGLLLMSSAPFFSQDAEARPAMSLDMSLSRTDLQPLNIFTCTVRFDNAGDSQAALVWINVTLPDQVVYVSDNAGLERGLKVGDQRWRFSSVSVGEHSLRINLQVAASADDGEVLTIKGHLEYYDKFFAPMPLIDEVTITINKPTWDTGDSASFEPGEPVGIVREITPTKPFNSTNGVRGSIGNGYIGDSQPDEEPPLPPPPVLGREDPLPMEIGPTSGDLTEPEEDDQDEPTIVPVVPPTDVTVYVGPHERIDDQEEEENPETYVDVDFEEEPAQTIISAPSGIDPSMVSSEIISNNRQYRPGDILTFTIFINNTGSQTAGKVMVSLTVPSSIRFLNDTSNSLGGKDLGDMTYLFTNVIPGNHEFLVFFSFEGEADESTEVEIWVHVSYTDSKGDFVGESTHMASCSVLPGPEEFPLLQISIAILSTGILSVVALSTNKLGAHSLLPFFVPLYSRLRRREILNHEARDTIIGYIKENPGEHFNSLKSKLDFRNGTLAHHLHILERERVIKSVRYGKYRRFFPMGMMVSKKAYPTELEQEILEVVRDRPGINQKTIAKKVGKSKSTVNYHIDKLRKSNKIRTEKNGLSLKHYVVEPRQ